MAGKRRNRSLSGSKTDASASRKSKRGAVVEEPVVDFESEVVDQSDFVPEETVVAVTSRSRKSKVEYDGKSRFVGAAVPQAEAKARWPHRYNKNIKALAGNETKNKVATFDFGYAKNDFDVIMGKGKETDPESLRALHHYAKAEVDGIVYDLNENAHVQAGEGEAPFICRIVELFEAVDKKYYVTCQWYYRAIDTPVKEHSNLVDDQRVFISEIKDDNPLDCLLEKISIVMGQLGKVKPAGSFNYYCDMKYLVPYSSFIKLPQEEFLISQSETPSTVSCEVSITTVAEEVSPVRNPRMFLLDLYAGCGAMSLGLCLGAKLAGFDLITRWAVDMNEYACETLRNNHPETVVRNEMASNFLSLLKEWRKLCATFSLIRSSEEDQLYDIPIEEEDEEDDNTPDQDSEIFEVEMVLDICYGDPNEVKKIGLYLQVRWKGYGPDEDTWEPIEGLSNCGKAIKEFVENGFKNNVLPLPGDVAVLCGGPPCQGISGFNRFRNRKNPLEDTKNEQIIVYMDIVNYLKPRFVLMENVVDLLKLSQGFLGKYALGRLISMNYQLRMGMLAAGSYGLPQFRMRVFLWGALPSETLPQFPLPTHEVDNRGVVPVEFEMNLVSANEDGTRALKSKLLLGDAISDLPPVSNVDKYDEMAYTVPPKTDFQKYIRLKKEAFTIPSLSNQELHETLYDHRSLELNADDYERVCQIPKKKGANFRDLKGVYVKDKKVYLDPNVKRPTVKSGKPLVPDYAISFINGTSSKPFGRMWWDEIVSTVVTRAEPHNQVVIHPVQDRVLSIRENARLQGFPDYYQLYGPVKERYMQVGNAVAVPVARALGYGLGLSFAGSAGNHPVFTLPEKFPYIENLPSDSSESQNEI